MRILLISDTHGRLDDVNRLAKEHSVECCFHLGDFCFYTSESVQRFSSDRLLKQLRHASQIPSGILSSIEEMDMEHLRKLAIEYRTYGSFDEYYSGKKHFSIPVYAVPGNNEDPEVFFRLMNHSPRNLTILDDNTQIKLEGFIICGLGGEINEGDSYDSEGYHVSGSNVRSLRNKVMNGYNPQKPRILLTHCPPYESTELMQLVQQLDPVLAICGHKHKWDERVLPSNCHVLTLPTSTRGHAVLELNHGQWSYQIYHTGTDV